MNWTSTNAGLKYAEDLPRRISQGESPKENLNRPGEGDVLVATGKDRNGYYARVVYAYEFEIIRSPPSATKEEALQAVIHFAKALNHAMGLYALRVIEDSGLLEPNVAWKNSKGKKQD